MDSEPRALSRPNRFWGLGSNRNHFFIYRRKYMSSERNNNNRHEVRVELKYCEHCGGLWVRERGAGVFCEKCQAEVDEFPMRKKRPGRIRLPQASGSKRKVVFEEGEEPAVAVVVVGMWEARFLRFPHFHNLVGRQNLVTLDLPSSPHKSAPGSHLGHGPGSTTQPKEFSNGDRSKPEPTTKGDAIGSESWYASSLPIRPGELQPTRTIRHVAV